MSRAYPLALSCAALGWAGAACQNTPPGRAAPTPGPMAAVTAISSQSGTSQVYPGERIRFAVVGTGSGTHFGRGTFLQSAALIQLQVVAVESSARLWAQGLVAIGAGPGSKDLAAVTPGGTTEIAVARDAFDVQQPDYMALPPPPTSSDQVADPSAGVIDPGGDVDLYVFRPPDAGAHYLIARLDVSPTAPADFQPTLEAYDQYGQALVPNAPRRCLSIFEASHAPIYLRVADPSRRGGPDRRYTLRIVDGDPVDCLTADPTGLVP